MCDFDLSEALEGSLDLDFSGCEFRCHNMPEVQEVQEEIIRLDEGLDLVVSQNLVTMKSATTLLMAVNRMKRPLTRFGRQLSNAELCSAIMEGLVTETSVTASVGLSAGLRRTFLRLNSDDIGTLCDVSKKDIVLASGDIKLQAITLKGGNCERKVRFKLARYVNSSVSQGETVVLSITNSRHISCSMEGGKAVMKLEECSKLKLQEISDDEDMYRFLFLKRTEGMSLNTFESVKCRGWFISTAYEDQDQSVEMCQVDTTCRLTSFQIN